MADHRRITAWWEVRVLPSPPRILVLTEIFRLPANSSEWAGLLSEVLSLQRRSLNLHSRFGPFVSALKIPFPRNGDFGSKRTGSNAMSVSAAPSPHGVEVLGQNILTFFRHDPQKHVA